MADERYPAPQVEVNAARDVGPVQQQASGAAQDKNAGAIEADFSMVTDAAPSLVAGAARAAWGAMKWLGREAIMPALEKLIPQGAAEIIQALFTPSAYVPYGPTERPVPLGEDKAATADQVAAPAVEPPAQETQGYQVFGPEQEAPANDNATVVGVEPENMEYARVSAPRRQQGLSR